MAYKIEPAISGTTLPYLSHIIPPKYWRNAKCYTYTTVIYYESEPFVNASVVVWLEGRNNWFQMGWTGNEFDDYVFARLTSNGWHNVTGKLKTGQGVYLK